MQEINVCTHNTNIYPCPYCKHEREAEAERYKWDAEKKKRDQIDRIEQMLVDLLDKVK